MEFSISLSFEGSSSPLLSTELCTALVLNASSTIKTLKESIWKRTIIPVRCQRLYLLNTDAEILHKSKSVEKLELLDDSKSLSDYGVNANNALILVATDSMVKLNIKKLSGEESLYYAHPNDLISQVKESIQLVEKKEPETISLMLKTEVLVDSKKLFEYGIGQDDVLHMVNVSSEKRLAVSHQSQEEEMERKPAVIKKSFHCAYDECLERYAKFIGDCHYCSAKFCSRHRLPEAHQCMNLNTCKKQSFESNQSKVMQGKCIASKII